MNRALAVLIVEASESDACRLVDWLSAAGYRVASARVETAAQMQAALAAQPWDVVIADCNLPQFSGAAALALLQEAGLDIAFIAVSGAQGEEAAAIIMKAGAHDYLLKSNLARLVPVIERELGQAESRRLRQESEAALQASEARYRELVENSQDLICTHDLEGNLLFVNQAAAIIFGYSSEALAQMNLRDLLPPKLRPLADVYLTEIRTQGCAAGVMQVRTAGGETRYLDYRNSLQQKGSTEPVAYSVARDITARIRAEAAMRVSQAQVTGIIAAAMDAIITTDAEQRIVIFNPAAEAMFGCSQTEARGQPLDRFIPARFRASHRLHIQRFAQTGVSARKIGQFGPVYGLRADGVEFPIEASISKIHVAGQDLFTVILRDVSAREQAAQALRRQLDTLHSLYQITALISQTEAVPEVVAAALNSLHSVLTADRSAIVLLDSAGVARFEAWRGLSDAYRRAVAGHFPWSLDDPAPQPILAPDVHQDASLASLSAVFVDEGIGALAFIPLSHQGRLLGKFMIYYNTPHAFSAEEIELTQTIARHVAFAIARKQATEALAASEMQLRALFASMQDVVLVIDREGVYRGIAPTNPALLVRPPEELLGKTLRCLPGRRSRTVHRRLPGRPANLARHPYRIRTADW
ncbi:PAS domain S-box protein [Candidatus Amarolinea dominans]|uniref:PAS domain S-box protein n=1 Tax=Candidatus Amarolinea dominans TaxID=3140696 RepID=UPI0031353E60|nr:PAS domain S-box protein [Anaerolineae bacterium]